MFQKLLGKSKAGEEGRLLLNSSRQKGRGAEPLGQARMGKRAGHQKVKLPVGGRQPGWLWPWIGV